MEPSSPPDQTTQLRSRSWEMELLISGFVLVLLLPLPTYLEQQGGIWLANLNISAFQQLFTIGFIVSLFGSRILIINLIIYLFLRGFWIGIVGLSSAFPDGTRWPRVSIRELYRKYLERKTPTTESYIQIINRISSSVFAFSFLLVFLIIAFFMALLPFILLVVAINTYFSGYPDTHWISQALQIAIPVFSFIYFSIALLFLVDFLSFGLIKCISWQPFMRLYFPLYRFFRWLTLAPLYTPIYYTLISNVPKRIISFALIAYLAIFFFFNNVTYSEEIFYPTQRTSYQIRNQHYEDQYDEPSPTLIPLIPSEYIDHDYLRIFLPYLVADNDSLQQICPEVKIFYEPGFVSDLQITFGLGTLSNTTSSSVNNDENVRAALHCLADLYELYLDDTLSQPSAIYFYLREQSNQPGLVAYLSLSSFSSGPHQLTVKKREFNAVTPAKYVTYYIPFVKD